MSEAAIQILLILAYLAIGLISITFPIYAICVTYLRQERHETRKDVKKRIEKLKKEIAKLTKDLSGEKKDSERFNQIQRKMKNYQSEEESLILRVAHLTAIGAVVVPVTLLVVALLASGAGIHFFYEGQERIVAFAIICSVVFCGAAVYLLFKTILAVEYASLRPARTIEFIVSYEERQESKEIKFGEEESLKIFAGTDEEDVENLILYIFVPPEVQIKYLPEEVALSPQPEGFKMAHYNMITARKDFLPKGVSLGVIFNVSVKKIGKHKIPVRVNAKGSYACEKELILNVVK